MIKKSFKSIVKEKLITAAVFLTAFSVVFLAGIYLNSTMGG